MCCYRICSQQKKPIVSVCVLDSNSESQKVNILFLLTSNVLQTAYKPDLVLVLRA